MSEITNIQTQAKNQERCNIYVDGAYCCSLSKFVVLSNHLFVGKPMSENEILNLAFESDKEDAFTYAVEYICNYVPTQKQLTKKLYDRKYTTSVIDYVISKCKEYGYINDLKYAQAYVFQNRKIKGKLRLEQELMNKGIKKEYIDEVLADYDEEDGCLTLARKKAEKKDLDDPKAYASLVRYLQGRGYKWEDIKESIDQVKKEREDV